MLNKNKMNMEKRIYGSKNRLSVIYMNRRLARMLAIYYVPNICEVQKKLFQFNFMLTKDYDEYELIVSDFIDFKVVNTILYYSGSKLFKKIDYDKN